MEKVYLVESELVCDYELLRGYKNVYKSKENAVADYNNEKENVSEVKEWISDEEKICEEEAGNCYEVYEEGYYSVSHGCVTLTELEVNP